MSDSKQISTTALAKKHAINSKELFKKFHELEYIIKDDNDSWILTDLGSKQGANYKESKQYGRYIVWPEDIKLDIELSTTESISATKIGQHFNISARKINVILSEIGWTKKGLKGWVVTEQGEKNGAIQSEDYKSGIPYVQWPISILENKTLINTIEDISGNKKEDTNKQQSKANNEVSFRDKFEAKHRSTDGHYTRSKAEMLIDNWLYMFEIAHAYERRLPIEEEVYSDFYLPSGKVYIEYWGYENDPKYLDRKKKKQEIYKKYNLNLIELDEKDVLNLDDVLPKYLLKYGIQTY